MSYGRFVHAAVEERQQQIAGVSRFDWQFQAEKLAASWAPDFPEYRVIEVLRDMRWPTRTPTCVEVRNELKRRVSRAERRAWTEENR